MEKKVQLEGGQNYSKYGAVVFYVYPWKRKEKEKRKICGDRKNIFVEKKEKGKTIFLQRRITME